MKRFNWLLIGLVVLCLAMVPLAGCVAKSEYEALQADYDALNADNDALQADYDELYTNYAAVEAELADIQQVYPPRDFATRQALVEWRNTAGIFDTPNPLDDCRSLQQIALQDGYIVSISVGLEELTYGCRAIAGDSIYQILPWELSVAWIDYVY